MRSGRFPWTLESFSWRSGRSRSAPRGVGPRRSGGRPSNLPRPDGAGSPIACQLSLAMTPRIDAAALLKGAGEAAGLSQRELADRAGTAQSVVARIELGQASPTVRTSSCLVGAAGASPEVSLRGGRPQDASAGTPPRATWTSRCYWTAGPTPRGRAEVRPGCRITADLIRALTFDDVVVVILNDAPPELAARIVLDGLRVFCGRLSERLDPRVRRTGLRGRGAGSATARSDTGVRGSGAAPPEAEQG